MRSERLNITKLSEIEPPKKQDNENTIISIPSNAIEIEDKNTIGINHNTNQNNTPSTSTQRRPNANDYIEQLLHGDQIESTYLNTSLHPNAPHPGLPQHPTSLRPESLLFPLEPESSGPTPSKKERILKFLHDKFPSRIVRRVLKCTLAYFLASLFSLITPLSNALGLMPYLVTTGMVYSHPGRTMGAQFDATLTAVLGILTAVLYSFIGIACSVAFNKSHPDDYLSLAGGRIINATFLFLGVFGAQTLRQAYPKFHFFSLQFMTIQIFSMTRTFAHTEMPFDAPMGNAIPLMIGHGISLVVNLLVWPETAIDGLGRALQETFTSSRTMLNLITKQFFLDPTSDPIPESLINSTAEKMRKGMTKVKSAYREAKYEISYAYIRPKQLGQVRKSLGRLTKHLSILGGCLKTERELFESAIVALHTEEMKDTMTDEESIVYPPHNRRSSSYSTPGDLEEMLRRSSTHSYSMDDLNLLKNALRATNDFTGPKTKPSPTSSRTHSRNNSIVHTEDEDVSDQNQKSVNSLKSFLHMTRLSIPNPKPPQKSKKQTEYHHRHLLLTYLESLRDPLMDLSMECTSALECVSFSVATELDVEDDKSVQKNWMSLLRHTLKIGERERRQEEMRERHKGSDQCNCSQNIRLAIIKFDKAERERMHALYQTNKNRMGELDLGLRQELFLVFFFIFTMREVANELQEMTLNMDELRLSSRKNSFNGKKRKHLYVPGMNWKVWKKWVRGNNRQNTRDRGGYSFGTLTTYMPNEKFKPGDADEEYNLSKIQAYGSRRAKNQKARPTTQDTKNSEEGDESPVLVKQRKRHNSDSDSDFFSLKKKKKDNTPIMLKIRYGIWLKLQYFQRYEFKCSLKMAIAVLVLCLPAFLADSYEWYFNVRGQWAPIAVIAIMNPTSGGTFHASFWRIIGTLVGAFTGWAALAAGDGSPYLLGLFAVLLALPFFYIHLGSTYNKVGIVTLITYMVVALSPNVNPTPGETIEGEVWKRTITLIIGICVALLLNSLIWPFVARHMIRKSIAGCMEQLEGYYTFLMGTYLYHNPNTLPNEEEIIRGEKMENNIQSAIDACNVLLNLTDHEPRFRGPFPKLFYKEMITCMRNILDRLLSTRTALLQMPLSVKRDICAKEYHSLRRDMIASLILNFHTLSASLRSKTSLPVYLPSARAARMKLIQHRRTTSKKANWVRFRNLTWFAMACSSEEIIEELEYFSDLVKYIVGKSDFADLGKKIDHFEVDPTKEKNVEEEEDPSARLTSIYTS